MITEHDLIEAIAECQGERNPNANTCIKLAAFYTIRREMFGGEVGVPKNATTTHSYAAAPEPVDTHIEYTSDTDFSRAINGREQSDVWPIIDELMSAIRMIAPRLYDRTMRRLQE